MFRSGRIGIALLIMRLSLVSTLWCYAFRFGPVASLFWWLPILLVISIALGLGAMTATTCLLYCAAEIGIMLSGSGFDAATLILSVPMAISLALLGPGAYSLDAHMFGRRVIMLPPDDNT